MKKIVLLIITVVAISSLVIVTCLSLKNNDSVESSSSLGGIISSESTQSPSSSAGTQGGDTEDVLSNIQFNTLEVTGKNVCGVVSNSSDNYSFLEEISIAPNKEYIVSLDEYGIQTVLTKIVPLSVGDNVFYIFELFDNVPRNTFIVTIRRRPIYDVVFDTLGGTLIEKQQVEEGFLVALPQLDIERLGYSFISWDYDFAKPVVQNITIFAQWRPINYSIDYNLDGGSLEGENPTSYNIENTTLLLCPQKNGYDFIGWYDNEKILNTLEGCVGNKILTAKWEKVFDHEDGEILGLTNHGKTLTEISIPETIDEFKITKIASKAFLDCDNLKSVTILDNITKMGEAIFSGCSNLEALKIPFVGKTKNPTEVSTSSLFGYLFGRDSYWGASKINQNYTIYSGSGSSTYFYSFYIPHALKTVTVIGGRILGGFRNCVYIENIVLEDGVTIIGEECFDNCTNLKNIELGNSITSIGVKAFYNCNKLSSLALPNSINYIGADAFKHCTSLEGNVENELCYLGSENNPYLYLLAPTSKDIQVASVNSNCKFIGSYAFADCKSLKQVDIPNEVVSIFTGTFSNCISLTEIEVPNSVQEIGSGAFTGCSKLQSIILPFVGGSKFENSTTSSIITLFGYIFGSESYTGGSHTKQYYSEGSSTAFYIPSSLKNVTIRGGDILYGSFYNCGMITNIALGAEVKNIGKMAFFNCKALSSIELGEGIERIYSDAFKECSTRLTLVNYLGDINQWAEILFGNSYSNPLYLAKHLKINGEVITDINLNTSTKISAYAFYNCDSLISVQMGSNINTIGSNAFYSCDNLAEVSIGKNVISIGDYAFYSCALKNITIPYNVESIGKYVFARRLEGIIFINPNGWRRISSNGGYSYIDDEFSNPQIAKNYLTSFYADSTWERQ